MKGALCLVGPTGVGKTAIALAFAKAHAAVQPVEIISVDSALVYRGMDIGTAKPSVPERAAVPHHLIDLIDPAQAYSAAQFVADATRVVGEVRARGHLPLLVGGTMLYFKALREGLADMPAANASVRAQLDAQAAAQGWPALHAELSRVDSSSAARLAPNDSQRIQRALEVWRVSGRSLTRWHQEGAAPGPPSEGDADAAQGLWPMVSLEPQSRAWLHERLALRYQLMEQAGFVQEVLGLRARGDLHLGLPSMRCVGYRQLWLALDQAEHAAGLQPTPQDGALPPRLPGLLAQGQHNAPAALNATLDLAAVSAAASPQALAATRQLAKRQLTWLRSSTWRQVVFCDDPKAQSLAVSALAQLAKAAA
jgi:tRNA dimethylallyltransferase